MCKKFYLLVAIISLFSAQNCMAQNYTLAIPTNQTNTYQNNFSKSFFDGVNDVLDTSNDAIFNTIGYITPTSNIGESYDPYFIDIEGNRYMLIKDNNDGIFDEKDMLGINDTLKTVFTSLRPLDINTDSKLTGDELSKAGIRLVKLDTNGKLLFKDKKSDFKNSDVVFIYIKELRKSYKNNGNSGEFGLFDVIIKDTNKNNKLVTGVVTFESKKELEKYL